MTEVFVWLSKTMVKDVQLAVRISTGESAKKIFDVSLSKSGMM